MSNFQDSPDDRTRLPAQPTNGNRAKASDEPDGATLPPGTMLHEFELQALIGEGGFGVVYRARDTQLQRTVAIKEYMPGSMSVRRVDGQVTLRSERHRETFEIGLRSFLKEAREMAAFDHPALVKVYRFWEANGTAYMVMPLLEGRTLKAHLAREGSPSEAWLRSLLNPILEALELLHGKQCYHRDIAPDNIMLLGPPEAPTPILLDFGAARRVLDDSTQALTVILKPGYAPLEQYAEVASLRQGPWTDVYALCATLYAAITGNAPPPAVARVVSDEWVPASVSAAGRYSPGFLAAIDAGLAVRPEHRPAGVADLRALLTGSDNTREPDADQTVLRETRNTRTERGARASAQVPQGSALTGKPQAVSTRKSAALWTGVAAAVAVAAAGAWLWGVRTSDQPEDSKRNSSAPAATQPDPDPRPKDPERQASALPQPDQAPRPVPVTPPPTRVFSVTHAFSDALASSDTSARLQLSSPKDQLVIGRDKLSLDLSSTMGGHVYLLLADAARKEVVMLFPNGIDANNKLAAGRKLRLPRRDWEMTVWGPPGTHTVLAIVSASPRDFKGAGLLKGHGDILEMDLQAWETRWTSTAQPAGYSAWLPPPSCAAPTPCDERFVAAQLEIEEVQR